MKKYMAAGALCLCLHTFLNAQTTESIHIGLHAGVNISNFAEKVTYQGGASQTGHEKAKAGFYGGVDAPISLGKGWYVQPELNFSQMGINAGKDDATGGDTKLSFNYISVPVVAKYVIEGTGLGIYAGPQYAYMLNAKASLSSGSSSLSAGATNYFYRSEFSILSGIEYYLPNGLGLSVRSHIGLSNVLKEPTILDVDLSQAKNISIRNRGIAITLGYRF